MSSGKLETLSTSLPTALQLPPKAVAGTDKVHVYNCAFEAQGVPQVIFYGSSLLSSCIDPILPATSPILVLPRGSMNTLLKLSLGYMSKLAVPNRTAAGATTREVIRNWMIHVSGHSVRQQEPPHREDTISRFKEVVMVGRRDWEKQWGNNKPPNHDPASLVHNSSFLSPGGGEE